MYNYKSLLSRARAKLPENPSLHERFEIPDVDIFYEGKYTVLRNFGDIVDKINREPEQLMAYLLRELGTPGTLDGKRIIFKSKLLPQQIADRIKEYVNIYVLCTECKRPDTKILKDDRTLILTCEACGAKRPVMMIKGTRYKDGSKG